MTQAARALEADETDLGRLLEHLDARGQALGENAVWYVGHRIAGELALAHAATDAEGNPAPVLHLGLRPEHVLITPDGRVRLAAVEGATGVGGGARVGAARGSLEEDEFAAPEQRDGGRVTHRTDVYRLGLLLWALLMRRRPRSDGSRPESLAALGLDIPRDVIDAIDAALEPSAGKRTITCMEIEQWLGTVVRAGAGERELAERVSQLRAEPERPKREHIAQITPRTGGAPPEARAMDRRAQPLSPLQSIAVAMITALIVVLVGVYIGDRVTRRSSAAALQGEASPGAVADP